jgi:predicted component of type VI protein secretion system|tara:strand:+ start:40 stop:279 length:240 start_codon:yes stop_codon:yes gene_type:complete
MEVAPLILRLDGEEFDLSKGSKEAEALVAQLQNLDRLLEEKRNLAALLTKAKNAYIAELKAEIIKNKTGVDLSSLFDEE